jgi:hypothetical protein
MPEASPLATLKPLGENRAMVVGAVWPVYSLQSEGSSMERTKIDFPALNDQNKQMMSWGFT